MPDRYFHFDKEIFSDNYPELIDTALLSASYSSLSDRMLTARSDLLSQRGVTAETVGSLQGHNALWYVKAVLLSLNDSLESQSPELRDVTLSHLFDMMFFRNRSVRSIAAATAGRMIVHYCESDMTVWSDFLRRSLFMKKDDTLTGQRLTEDPLRITFLTVYGNIREDLKKQVLNAYASYFKSTRWDPWTCLRLISGIITIPVKEWGSMQKGNIGGFIRYFLRKSDAEIRVASFCLLQEWLAQGWKPSEDFRGYIAQSIEYINANESPLSPAENELIRTISYQMDIHADTILAPPDKVLYLNNLRSNHFWLYKTVNLHMLRDKYGDADRMAPGFDTYVTHLLTLLRLNADEVVFRMAGEDLLYISDKLSARQKYETVRELFKVIETGYDATGYVPEFLGRFFGKISSELQAELLPDIQELCNSRVPDTVGNALETICSIVGSLAGSDHPDKNSYMIRKLCGLISQSLYSDMEGIRSHVLFSTGNELFSRLNGTGLSPNTEENECFAELARNTLICMKEENLDLLIFASPVKQIADWLERYCTSSVTEARPVAFYSGSFDPFSNGHHAIVREIAQMGYQVYVNVHDFAQGRNVVPLLVRRQIAAMSVTDLPHVQLFPEEISINVENPKDLVSLAGMFGGRKVWLVAGSYRIEEDDMYRHEPFEGSVHSFPHIVFMRNETHGYFDESDIRNVLTGDLITLKLPSYYEHMTSGEIRANIQEGKSIEGLVAGQIQNYIKRHNLYSSNVTVKPDMAELAVITEAAENECRIFLTDNGNKKDAAYTLFHTYGSKICLDRAEIYIEPADMYSEILLDETLLELQKGQANRIECPDGLFNEDLLSRRGFLRNDAGNWEADMSNPMVIFPDAASAIMDTFADDEKLKEVFAENTRNLQEATSHLYPGSLVLTVNTGIMYYRLGEKIRELCRRKRICVPFGKILKSVSIPGATIMPLNTEKRYDPQLRSFTVCEKVGYPVLQTQMRNIRSMDQPFVLVDDLFHKGYRMNKISAGLSGEGMKEDGIIVGVCSLMGRELADEHGYNVDTVYEVPHLRHWLIESDMIPFFAGDKAENSFNSAASSAEGLPSMYPLLPYQYPSFLKDAPFEAVYRMSEACIENAIRLFRTLEALYREKYHRTLTLSRLSEVITEAGYPENFFGREELADRTASELLESEMIRLSRLSKN